MAKKTIVEKITKGEVFWAIVVANIAGHMMAQAMADSTWFPSLPPIVRLVIAGIGTAFAAVFLILLVEKIWTKINPDYP